MSNAEFDEEAWRTELRQHRDEKDRAFAQSEQSPLPPEERDRFDGLSYYPPDADYRVTATVQTHDEPEPVEMELSAGAPQRYLHVVTLYFGIGGEDCSLAAYRQTGGAGGDRAESGASAETSYFVPFRDATSGEETYGSGRYMELYAERELDDGDEIVVDFNLAYSPFCAYSEAFACPLPPAENRLDVRIEAGEKYDGEE